ncbi:MAG: IclR family transcriptional regulator [Methylibium sp.]|nr:IclR family transcriptional regulator [Methylibium sp.]
MHSTLVKGLAVLDWLIRQQRGCRVADVALAFGMARSNAHRILHTLAECGWARQDERTSAYRASLRVFELGALIESAAGVRWLLRSHLALLARETGETIHLAALDGTEIVYLDKFGSPLPVIAYSRVGGRAPAYCVASGKALLAAGALARESLREGLGVLRPQTPNTLTDFDALWADLERTRARGYAENREEWRVGVCGLGAPVFNALNEPVAAVGVTVPSIRFARPRVRQLADRLLACARDARATLGYGSVGQAPALDSAASVKRR